MSSSNLPTLTLLAAMLVVASWYDATAHRIPNWITFGGALIAVVLAALPGGIGLKSSLAGCAIGLSVVLPFYLGRAMGGGDVKLMAAVGAYLGFPAALGAALATFVMGGIWAVTWTVRGGRLGIVVENLRTGLYMVLARFATGGLPRAGDLPVTSARMPYALAITTGTIAYLLMSGGYRAGTGF